MQIEQLLTKCRFSVAQREIPYEKFEERVDLGLPSIDLLYLLILADFPGLIPKHFVDFLV